jgi:NAD(P)-dependent dehydrogenase (short-subunit alcohol dehydrogenase family)
MSYSLFDLTGRVALVTGGARGMGRAMALAFAEMGADLLLADLNTQGVENTARMIEGLGRCAVAVTCDISDPEHITALLATLDREFGKIDILGNVAGEGILGRPEELSLEQVNRNMQSLAVGRFFLTQQAGKRMLAAGKGSIINIGSLASITALGRGHVAYSMAMGAVAQMTRELSTEWSGKGVRVNAILCAQVMNPGLEKRMQENPELKATFLRGIPAGRLGVPEDIKGVAIFLASDASAWITGALIPMDGGNLAMNAGGSHTW